MIWGWRAWLTHLVLAPVATCLVFTLLNRPDAGETLAIVLAAALLTMVYVVGGLLSRAEPWGVLAGYVVAAALTVPWGVVLLIGYVSVACPSDCLS